MLRPAEDPQETIREMLSFSNALARSSKLAVLEEQLDHYLEKHRGLPRYA